jgi:hypothetical protein
MRDEINVFEHRETLAISNQSIKVSFQIEFLSNVLLESDLVATATLSNAFDRLIQMRIISTKKSTPSSTSSSSIRLMSLHPDWIPSRDQSTGNIQAEGKLWSLLEKLGSFRREGKNRRDSKTGKSLSLLLRG